MGARRWTTRLPTTCRDATSSLTCDGPLAQCVERIRPYCPTRLARAGLLCQVSFRPAQPRRGHRIVGEKREGNSKGPKAWRTVYGWSSPEAPLVRATPVSCPTTKRHVLSVLPDFRRSRAHKRRKRHAHRPERGCAVGESCYYSAAQHLAGLELDGMSCGRVDRSRRRRVQRDTPGRVATEFAS